MRGRLWLLILSTIAYAVTAVLSYPSVHSLPLYGYLLALGTGALIGSLCLIKASGLSFKVGSARGLAMEVSGGIALAISSIGIYALYKSTTLAGAQPLLGIAMLAFLAIDFVIFRKSLKMRGSLILAAGILAIVVGVFVIQSTGFTFNFGILPIVLFLMITQGAGYYLILYGTRQNRSATRLVAWSSILILESLLVLSLTGYGLHQIQAVPFLMCVAAGASLAIAIGLEVMFVLPRKKTHWGNIIERNFANDFTYSDILIVLAASIAIGSYTMQQIIGGLVILAGIIGLNRVREE